MSLWQTYSWQSMLKNADQTEVFFEIDGIFIEKRQVSLWEYALFAIGVDRVISHATQQKIKSLCHKERALFVQIETLNYSWISETSFFSFKKKYYKKFIPTDTCVIDLEKSEEEILWEMKPKGRYNIRLARKKWIVVEQVEKTSENIQIFFKLIEATTSRDKFSGNTLEYYTLFLEALENSQIFFSYYEGEVISAGIFIPSGEVYTYYYGASSNSHRNLMAPYLLQWEAIQHAKKRGYTLYDFLGISSPWEKNSPLAWVTDFKKKFSQDIRRVSNAYIFIRKKWKYFWIMFLRKFKR